MHLISQRAWLVKVTEPAGTEWVEQSDAALQCDEQCVAASCRLSQAQREEEARRLAQEAMEKREEGGKCQKASVHCCTRVYLIYWG